MLRNCYTMCCILATIIGTIVTEPGRQFPNRNNERIRYYKGRRWFLRDKNLKYILHWTSPKVEPFNMTGVAPFTRANCSKTNCIITKDKAHIKDIRLFDAIIFHGPDFWYDPNLLDHLPATRSWRQKYIYFSAESADYYPMCDIELNDFFNLTWTYKLNSDLPFPYFIVRDSKGAVIGPKPEMHWMKVEEMLPVDQNIKEKLEKKTEAVAWLVSICETASRREELAQNLSAALSMYSLNLDMYGKCSKSMYKCGRPDLLLADCWEMFQMEYYFYLSFENSFDEDYVTEKLLNPLHNYIVPIVYGAANYTRFLPEGSYLNAMELGVTELAKEIRSIINDKERYYSFFKWRNHYSFHSVYDSPETNPFCSLCEMLNKKRWKKTYPDFKGWWNVAGRCPTETVAATVPKEILFV